MIEDRQISRSSLLENPNQEVRQYEMVEIIKEDFNDADEDQINKAYVYSMIKHGKQIRSSGDRYFSASFSIAVIAYIHKPSVDLFVLGLLKSSRIFYHDILSEISNQFGEKIGRQVALYWKVQSLIHLFSSDYKIRPERIVETINYLCDDDEVLHLICANAYFLLLNMDEMRSNSERNRHAYTCVNIILPIAYLISSNSLASKISNIIRENFQKKNIIRNININNIREGRELLAFSLFSDIVNTDLIINNAERLKEIAAEYNEVARSTAPLKLPENENEIKKLSGQRGKRTPKGVKTVPKQFGLFPDVAGALEAAAATEGVSTSRYLNDLLADHPNLTPFLDKTNE